LAQETISMSRKERERLLLMTKVRNQELALQDAAQELRLSYRQARRILRRFKSQGAQGLVHRSRGRRSNRAKPSEFKERVVALRKEHYGDYGPTLAAEVLQEDHRLTVHPETLRRWLHEKGELMPKTRRRIHRRRRERRPHFGALLQVDGSHHAWFEERGPSCCLMVAVDDATGRTMALLSEEETLDAAYGLLRKWVERYGAPEEIYADKKSVYHGDRYYFKQGRPAGAEAQGDFLRACGELGIRLIPAHSPQAKGRVERKNGVLQDRLVKELRRRQLNTITEANAMLDEFLDKLDRKFALAPQQAVDRHRLRPSAQLLNRIFSRETTRSIQADWTISWQGHALQILPQDNLPRPRERVTVRQCQDGACELIHRGKPLEWRPAKTNTSWSVPPPRGGGTAVPESSQRSTNLTTTRGQF
jgi:transposase